MDTLLTCPRCRAYVQPDWPSCKICGFDPSYEGTYESIYSPKAKSQRPRVMQVIGAMATLSVIVGLCYLSVTFIHTRIEHRDDSQLHQQIVTIDH